MASCASGPANSQELAASKDYPAIAREIARVTMTNLFSPKLAQSPELEAFFLSLEEESAGLTNDQAFVGTFRKLWGEGYFSHYDLRLSDFSVEQMIAQVDQFEAGPDAVELTLEPGNPAILRVSTMMGNDTITAIHRAFEEIAGAQPEALIVDLRGNGGGAFAVQALLSHLISEPADLGFFLGQKGWMDLATAPVEYSQEERVRTTVEPWETWEVSSFWQGIKDQGILRIRMKPIEPVFSGPVVVLVDNRTRSAAEMAADGLRQRDDTVFIGEPTPGRMLSQSPFDVGEGFQLWLPIADYFSFQNGRIEGVGVPVDREVPSAEALDAALGYLK
jgi:C-terminal processing protease CtpA/Prc